MEQILYKPNDQLVDKENRYRIRILDLSHNGYIAFIEMFLMNVTTDTLNNEDLSLGKGFKTKKELDDEGFVLV